MSDATNGASSSESAARPATAGGMLRAARQAQGLHIAALAAAIKVVPRKLELLESDQFDQLPDATFVRALAQTVCRTLKIDPVPILALLPPPRGARLEQVAEGLNTPFHERPGQLVPKEWAGVAMPAVVVAGLLVLGAIAMLVLPAGWWQRSQAIVAHATSDAASAVAAVTESVPTPAATSASAVVVAPTQAQVPVSVSASAATMADSASAAAAPSVASEDPPAPTAVNGVLQMRPTEASWVEVIDANGKPLISRLLQAGESVGLDGVMPFKVKIGNANATQVVFRGQPLELGPFTRDNMAKLELK